MASKHTPGPWRMNGNYVSGSDSDGRAMIAHLVVNNDTMFAIGRAEANARLIAEAPAMLAIIRQMLDQARGNAGKPMPDVLIGQALLLVARIDGEG